jgi:hypothetical protein
MVKKNSSSRTWLVALIVLLFIGITGILIWTYSYVSWAENYEEDPDLPYGTSLFKDLVSMQTGDRLHDLSDTMATELQQRNEGLQNHNYVYIGRHLYLDSAELSSLLQFVENGNKAMLISYNFNAALLDTLFDIPSYSHEWYYVEEEALIDRQQQFFQYADTSVFCSLNFKDSQDSELFECKYVRDHKPLIKTWPYFNPELETASGKAIDNLGYFNDEQANFIAVTYGKGEFYLHSTPLALTNYSLLQKPAFDYANKLIALLDNGDVLWETKGRDFTPSNNPGGGGNSSRRGGTDYGHEDGPLAFILTEISFKWAWYILITATLLYFGFGAKRKQKIVPVINPPENTSLEFAETIGRMYRAQNNHRNIVNLKFKLFLQFVRDRYGIRTNQESTNFSEDLIQRISILSDIPIDHINNIFKLHQALQISMEVSNDQLIEFYQLLDYFHQNCK